jgi:hypothetical protein
MRGKGDDIGVFERLRVLEAKEKEKSKEENEKPKTYKDNIRFVITVALFILVILGLAANQFKKAVETTAAKTIERAK